MDWLFSRLKERSTWLGLLGVAAGFGLGIEPDLAKEIVGIGTALAGLLAMLTAD